MIEVGFQEKGGETSMAVGKGAMAHWSSVMDISLTSTISCSGGKQIIKFYVLN